jgi:flagellar basal body-associated protein FliL
MSVSFDPQFDPQFNSPADDPAMFARSAIGSVDTGARAGVVNRTHRVVRQRAKVMQERRSYVRSLMVPLAICSVLLMLVCAGVWTGLYQYEATEAAEMVQADVAALDANNHLLVVLLWFVPVMLALVGGVLFRLLRNSSDRRTVR